MSGTYLEMVSQTDSFTYDVLALDIFNFICYLLLRSLCQCQLSASLLLIPGPMLKKTAGKEGGKCGCEVQARESADGGNGGEAEDATP